MQWLQWNKLSMTCMKQMVLMHSCMIHDTPYSRHAPRQVGRYPLCYFFEQLFSVTRTWPRTKLIPHIHIALEGNSDCSACTIALSWHVKHRSFSVSHRMASAGSISFERKLLATSLERQSDGIENNKKNKKVMTGKGNMIRISFTFFVINSHRCAPH